jgi:uncharacterized protein YjiS (DUF1127 family)
MTFITPKIVPEELPAFDRGSVALSPPRRRGGAEVGALALTKLRVWWRRHQSRTRLAELDAHMLKDIGVTFAEAEREVNKPFWLP